MRNNYTEETSQFISYTMHRDGLFSSLGSCSYFSSLAGGRLHYGIVPFKGEKWELSNLTLAPDDPNLAALLRSRLYAK